MWGVGARVLSQSMQEQVSELLSSHMVQLTTKNYKGVCICTHTHKFSKFVLLLAPIWGVAASVFLDMNEQALELLSPHIWQVAQNLKDTFTCTHMREFSESFATCPMSRVASGDFFEI